MSKKLSAVRIVSPLIFLALLIGLSLDRPWYRPAKPSVSVPPAVSAWLRNQESAFALRPGLQKEVTWAGSEAQVSDWALAYLHGFSASRKEISPTLEQVSEILRANVFWSRLTGHGMDGEAFKNLDADHFFKDGEEAFQILNEIGRHRVLIGASTGATLALAEALWHPDLDALILISPNFGVASSGAELLGGPLGPWVGRLVFGGERSWKAKSLEQEKYWTTRYRTEGLTAMIDLVNAVKRMPLEELRVPCLVLLTKADQVIDLAEAQKALTRLPKDLCVTRWIEAPDHVLAGDVLSPNSTAAVVSEILSFIRAITEKSRTH